MGMGPEVCVAGDLLLGHLSDLGQPWEEDQHRPSHKVLVTASTVGRVKLVYYSVLCNVLALMSYYKPTPLMSACTV